MLPFHQVVKADFERVNALIIEKLHSDVPLVENIGEHLIEAGGKRLRPLLVLLSANSCHYEGRNHIALAALIEFIHTATLLHDDVVDTSDLRRGRPTANARFGNAPSVLAGDFLYSRAFQMLVDIGDLDILRVVSDTTNILSEGEVQQLINAGDPDTSEEAYNEVIRKKTAQLFSAAAESAALLANARTDHCEALKLYGHHLGMAFQLVDDALDFTGDTDALGKNIGDDLAEGKPTLPLIYTIQQGTAAQSDLIRQAISTDEPYNLEHIIDAIQQSGGIEYTLSQATQHTEQAKTVIQGLPETAEKTAMLDLADFALARTT